MLGRVIAKRILGESGRPKVRVMVEIGEPRFKAATKVWICPFVVEGSGTPGVKEATGEDSFQALVSAIQGVRAIVEQSNRRLFWLGPSLGHFIPRYLPFDLTPDSEKRVLRAIELETEQRLKVQIKRDKIQLKQREINLKAKGLDSAQRRTKLQRPREVLRKVEESVKNLTPGWSSPLTVR